ncbi:MAG: DUF4175 family protein [Alphaproteobacteria bacterium]|nr:DUF4175 family protein [Alphaproteobacteria bacterium]
MKEPHARPKRSLQPVAAGGPARARGPKIKRGQKPSRRLRYAIIVALLVCAGFGLGGYAGRWVTGKPVSLGWLWPSEPSGTLTAWITPPAYTGSAQVMLAGPEVPDKGQAMFDVPEGSVLNVEVSGGGRAPVLHYDGKAFPLTPDDGGGFKAAAAIKGGRSIALRRGWRTLASWNIRVVRDTPPRVAFLEPLATVDGTSTRLSYEISDDYGVETLVAHVSPGGEGPRQGNAAEAVVLASPHARHGKVLDIQDLTYLPWAGMTVDIQLEVRDGAGQKALSDKMSVALPKRSFSHPLARALIEEREKLLQKPDETTRDEAANIMAGIARETADDHGDPVVYMALRTGAVRLVLDHQGESVPAVSLLLWQAAARIEDNLLGKARNFLQQAHREKG